MNKRFLCVLSALLVAVGLFMLYQPSKGEDSAILSDNYEAVLQEDGVVGSCEGNEIGCVFACPNCYAPLYADTDGMVVRAHGICPACGRYIDIKK